MEDVLLERFLEGDSLLIRQLRPIVLDFVTKTGGLPDDAREVFQIVSLTIFERSKRTPSQYLSKAFKTWLNKRRKNPPYVSERAQELEASLDHAFAGYTSLKTEVQNNNEAAVRQFIETGNTILVLFVEAEGGTSSDAGTIVAVALEKIQRVILDFQDYFLKSCKNEWLRLKNKRGMISSEEFITHAYVADDTEVHHHELSNVILNLLHKASEACKKLLHPLFIEGKTKEELLVVLGYGNPGSFDVAKSRCLKALQSAVKQNPYFKLADA